MLTYLFENNCPLYDEICEDTASAGQLVALRFLKQRGCKWEGERVCEAAAGKGHYHVCEWVLKDGKSLISLSEFLVSFHIRLLERRKQERMREVEEKEREREGERERDRTNPICMIHHNCAGHYIPPQQRSWWRRLFYAMRKLI